MKARENPFRTECILRVRYRLHGRSWGDLMDRLDALRYRAAIIGPEGSGKTTLLEDLAPMLRARGFGARYVRFDGAARAQSDPCRDLTERDVLLLDGADALPGRVWRRIRRMCAGAAGLVVTSHVPGFLPTLHECLTQPGLLEQIAVELAGRDDDAFRGAARGLFASHDGNLRTALRELYDIYAAMSA